MYNKYRVFVIVINNGNKSKIEKQNEYEYINMLTLRKSNYNAYFTKIEL